MCYPESTVSGRRGYEIAFATAYMFSGTRPRFVMVDEVTFQRPVDVGDLLRLRSLVLHTAPLPDWVAGTCPTSSDRRLVSASPWTPASGCLLHVLLHCAAQY